MPYCFQIYQTDVCSLPLQTSKTQASKAARSISIDLGPLNANDKSSTGTCQALLHAKSLGPLNYVWPMKIETLTVVPGQRAKLIWSWDQSG